MFCPIATAKSVCLLSLALMAGGCCSQTVVGPGLSAQAVNPYLVKPANDSDVAARVAPPIGWKAEPLKASAKHKHQVWLSPTGNTAYGVIYFSLPLPLGPDLALWAFLDQMKRTEGQARLVSKQEDDALPGLRFVAEGGLYMVRTNLILNGFHGWAIYAGTVRGKPVDESELRLAIDAREQTRVEQE